MDFQLLDFSAYCTSALVGVRIRLHEPNLVMIGLITVQKLLAFLFSFTNALKCQKMGVCEI